MIKGYFGIGFERLSKPQNAGTVFRTAYAFGGHFLFAVAPIYTTRPDGPAMEEQLRAEIGMVDGDSEEGPQAPRVSEHRLRASDTSGAADSVPLFVWPDVPSMVLPQGCSLVGIELTDDAVSLPSFRHPRRAAYVLGPERGSLSPELTARCDHVVKIPTAFCLNVAQAATVVLYDRMLSLGRFAERPVRSGRPTEGPPEHIHGTQVIRSERRARQRAEEANAAARKAAKTDG